MGWLERTSVATATFCFCLVPLACGDDAAEPPADTPDANTVDGSAESSVISSSGQDASSMATTEPGSDASSATESSPGAASDAGSPSTDEVRDASMNTAPAGDGGTIAMEAAAPMDPQVPPIDAVAMQAWLESGYYLDWVCEDEPNAKTDGAPAIHVHGAKTRVCSNVMLAASPAPGSNGEFPAGSAAVKEVYDDEERLIATVVSVKTANVSDNGNNWYWYGGPEAEGLGFAGCTGCHSAAAADAEHPGAGDFVYFQVTNEAQLPPVGDVADVQAWLTAGHYLDWTCEQEPNIKTEGAPAIHAHPKNRICVNDKLAASELAPGEEWPAGVAAVKELYDGDGGTMTGAVLYTKIGAASDGGNGFFWFAGEGATGFGVSACTGCHSAAGSDEQHPGAGDFVYDRVVP